ncbi:DUF6716 putative glycosyltransferase [Psychrobacter celer]|uniref:DUF6716 putative glycosyltransferase n=1 Tax=Psychrobacter celer TaxID=306572 RepID=UPI003FD57CFA
MKIAFLFKKDSHFKAVHTTALRLCEQYECMPVFIGIDTDYHPKGNKRLSYIQRDNLDCLVDYDYVVACLGGYLLNFVIRRLASTQTKVVSIFPGIVSHYQLDAFISRLNADQVWLNSRADYELYSKICKVLRVKNNGLLYGMSWLDLNLCSHLISNKSVRESAIIFEQTEVLSNFNDKLEWGRLLKKIIISNPKVSFIYKVRDNSSDIYFRELRSGLSRYDNVEIVSNLEPSSILNSKYFLSISSSALVEGLAYNKISLIVGKKLQDLDSKEFYHLSNLELMSNVLKDNNNIINSKWKLERILLPKSKINLLAFTKKESYMTFETRSYSYLRLLIIQLAVYYPKVVRLILDTRRLKATQKSLEYSSI